MTPDDVAARLDQYARARWDLSIRWYICFELGWSSDELPEDFRAALGKQRVSTSATREEQGGRPILLCRHRAIPTAATVRRLWTRIDAAGSAHGVPPVEAFYLSRV